MQNKILFVEDDLSISEMVKNYLVKFGMRKKSVSATIVASVLVATLLSSNTNGFSLSSIIAIPLSFAVIGVIIAYLSIRNIEHTDIDN